MASEALDNLEEFSPAEIITNALKAWEEYNFKDLDLWELFKEDFEGWTEDDFKLAQRPSNTPASEHTQKTRCLGGKVQICNSEIIIQDAARRRTYTMDRRGSLTMHERRGFYFTPHLDFTQKRLWKKSTGIFDPRISIFSPTPTSTAASVSAFNLAVGSVTVPVPMGTLQVNNICI